MYVYYAAIAIIVILFIISTVVYYKDKNKITKELSKIQKDTNVIKKKKRR